MSTIALHSLITGIMLTAVVFAVLIPKSVTEIVITLLVYHGV